MLIGFKINLGYGRRSALSFAELVPEPSQLSQNCCLHIGGQKRSGDKEQRPHVCVALPCFGDQRLQCVLLKVAWVLPAEASAFRLSDWKENLPITE